MPLTRDEAIAVLDDGHRALERLADRLSRDDFDRLGTIGGGEWSAKLLIGHVTSWEEHALEALEAWRAGRGSAVQRDLRGRGLSAVNATAAAADRDRSPDEVRARAQAVHRRLVAALEAVTQRDWTAPPTRRSRRSLGEVVGSILGGPDGPFTHAAAHLPDLTRYVGDR